MPPCGPWGKPSSPSPVTARPRAWFLELYFAAGVSVLVLAIWVFSALVEDVLDRDALVRWDAAVAAWVHADTTPHGVRFFSALTELGSAAVTWSVAAAGVAVLRLRPMILTGWAAAFVGAAILEKALKAGIQRHRPPLEIAYVDSHSYSFPSGHALKGLVCYMMIAFVLGRLADRHGARRIALYVAAAGVVLAIGWSRIYLGAHYPSDVFGAYAAGLAWLTICLVGIRLAERRWGEPRSAR
jgi:membrane-associated phospholipid phosphatase